MFMSSGTQYRIQNDRYGTGYWVITSYPYVPRFISFDDVVWC